MRTGADYLKSLNDGRQVFVEGERVKDVSTHLAFREAARSVARLYDIAADPANRELMTFPSPKTGKPVLARLPDPPHARRPAGAAAVLGEVGGGELRPDGPLARPCGGLLHRLCRGTEVFAAGGQKFADNVVAFYERMRDEHLYLSYAIVPPQIDRSKPAHQAERPDAARRRGEGARRRHRHQGRAAGGDRRRAVRLGPSQLHPSDAAWRRKLRQLRRDPDQRAGREAFPAAALCAARDQFLRLSAVDPVRRVGQLRGVRRRVRAVGARVHLPQSGDHPRPVVEDALARSTATTRPRCATSPSCASCWGSPSAPSR